jgi:small subunit ribosomal protein S17
MEAEGRKSGRRTLVGRVVSNKMDKTIVVEVRTKVQHPKYRKYISRRKTFAAHDEGNVCQPNDEVVIQESRPLSRTKRWVVIERRAANS